MILSVSYIIQNRHDRC